MPVSIPPSVALAEFLAPTTRHTRRIEIYEQDGITRWTKDVTPRLKGGQVTVDYSRDERRALDLVLSNDDGVLVNAPGEFWYDKIIKVFRGVRIDEPTRVPKILVLSDKTGVDQMAPSFREVAVNAGFGDVQVNTVASDYDVDVAPYDIIVGLGAATSGQIDLLVQAYQSGKSVLVQDDDAEPFVAAAYPTTGFSADVGTAITPVSTTHPMASGWASFTREASGSVNIPAPTTPHWTKIAAGSTSGNARVSAFAEPVFRGRAAALSFPINFEQYDMLQFQNLLTTALHWLNTVKPLAEWEVQIGEFMIDRITEPHFPYEMRITGRDYTKKCMLSKFAHATSFTSGIGLESLIAAIAGAAGIFKRLLPATGIVIGRSFFYEAGVTRWDAMKEIATAYDHELFFDAQGYLVLRPYNDPATTPPILYIETGKEGQIASYEKSTTDARIYNHVIVRGESSDKNIPPVWGEAKNEDPNSPTSIQELGDRLLPPFDSAFVTTMTQAQELADSLLAIHSLEEFELNFESLLLPWVEVGDILGWIDPNPAPDDPNTFLLSQVTLPLELAPMSGTARRVTNVGV